MPIGMSPCPPTADGQASGDAARAARAAAWRQDQAERQAICAGLDWQDCIRALVAAKRMSPGTAGHMGVAL